jgi:hypothetical protein
MKTMLIPSNQAKSRNANPACGRFIHRDPNISFQNNCATWSGVRVLGGQKEITLSASSLAGGVIGSSVSYPRKNMLTHWEHWGGFRFIHPITMHQISYPVKSRAKTKVIETQ